MLNVKKNVMLAAVLAVTLGFGLQAHAQTAPLPQVTVPDFTNLAEALLPTVVNVSTTQAVEENQPQEGMPDMPQLPGFPPGTPFEDFFKDYFEKHQGVPQQHQRAPSALGSGFVIDAENGYIVTNNHVIKDADDIKVILHDDTTVEAKLIGTDEKTDVAVLQIKTDKKLHAIVWGDSDMAKVGSWVLAIGNPFGLGGTVTSGIVSARQRDINAGPYDEFIQSDASINRGNSGGPMFNMRGEVIGLNTAIFSPSGGSVGIGFAIPSNLARPVVEQLIKYGKTKRGWIGVQIQSVNEEIAESLGMTEPMGALISEVTPKGPAEAAGVKAGDVIIKFNGHDIKTMRQLPRTVAETEIGRSVPITVWRQGAKKDLNVTTGQLEKAEETGLIASADQDGKTGDTAKVKGTAIDQVGIEVSPLTDATRKAYSVKPEIKGVLITKVTTGSPADSKGLNEGDVIVEVDQKEVLSPAQVEAKVKEAVAAKKGSILFFIARGDDLRFVAVRFKKNDGKK